MSPVSDRCGCYRDLATGSARRVINQIHLPELLARIRIRVKGEKCVVLRRDKDHVAIFMGFRGAPVDLDTRQKHYRGSAHS